MRPIGALLDLSLRFESLALVVGGHISLPKTEISPHRAPVVVVLRYLNRAMRIHVMFRAACLQNETAPEKLLN